jgi:hypothetical protein
MWKNIELDTPRMKIRRMCISCWTTKGRNKEKQKKNSKYSTLIAFPLQQWLRERTSTLL